MSETKKIMIGLLLGVAVGLGLAALPGNIYDVTNTYLLSPVGTVFLNLIKMLVVPIVFFSIILGVMGLGDPKELGRVGTKSLLFFLTTTAIAIVLALGVAQIIKPGDRGDFPTTGLEFDASGSEESSNIVQTFVNMIPTNPVQALAEGNMLQIIVFAALIGFAMIALGEKARTWRRFVKQGDRIMMYLIHLVMKLAPYGAFALIASAIGGIGLDAVYAMGWYMFAVVLTLFLHSVVVYGGAVALIGKMNPIFFFKNFYEAMTFAFSTSSSNATLPVSMEVAQTKLGVPRSISSFVQPLGATVNMDGTAIMQGVATIFIAQVFNADLTITELATVVITAVLASIGTAGVPGVGLVMLALVLQSVNLPVEGIALIIGVDRVLDMLRTSVNITGDAACAVVVSKLEEKHLPAVDEDSWDEVDAK
ncbi:MULTISPECIES: dicarboxylate/amino acid:cation symporter [Exiguobacterium]|uniref:dicarboxylate/amino acid:cation symporter n=1 Tax=Exiguobacterium TaxID=33986 RepID=UPI001BEA3502|nr:MULTISPECIES: dicarboxylate/amino acid:cation symporter [Exiguobacterium]MCT4777234.1 dicarboxylate/amino acid:cation symporter [Exiguobacterium aquaticum]MCT4789412.1 dicarboxylate/amino acid:cation symporter [Exiguobacterium mexicanum]